MASKSVDELKADAVRLDALMQDPAVQDSFDAIEKEFVEEMIGAKESAHVWKAQGKILALRALKHEIEVLIDRGEVELIKEALVAKQKERKGLLQ